MSVNGSTCPCLPSLLLSSITVPVGIDLEEGLVIDGTLGMAENGGPAESFVERGTDCRIGPIPIYDHLSHSDFLVRPPLVLIMF